MILKKIYIISITLGIIILILMVFLVYPLFKRIKQNSQELIEEKRELIDFESHLGKLENFRKLYKYHQPHLEKINQLFIDPKAPVDFIQFLEKTASESGVSIEISPQTSSLKEAGVEPWSSVIFQISSVGTFLNSLKFLGKLESSQYLIEVQNLNMGKSVPGNDIKATFFIKVFTR